MQDVPGAVTAANLAAAAAGVLVIVLLVRAGSRPSPRLAGLLAGAGFFWATVTLARTGEADPYSTRYVYLGAVLILLIGVELMQGVRISPALRRALAAGAVVSSALGVVWLAVGASERRDDARILRAELGALELAGDRANPLFRPDTDIRAGFLTTLPYLLAVDKYGESPGDSPQELAGRSEAERREADRVLVQATGLSLRPAGTARPAAAPPRVDGAAGGQVRRRRGCLELRPRGALGAIDLTLPPGGVRLAAGRAGATVQVRRFADGYGIEPAGTLSRAPVLLGRPPTGRRRRGTPEWPRATRSRPARWGAERRSELVAVLGRGGRALLRPQRRVQERRARLEPGHAAAVQPDREVVVGGHDLHAHLRAEQAGECLLREAEVVVRVAVQRIGLVGLDVDHARPP